MGKECDSTRPTPPLSVSHHHRREQSQKERKTRAMKVLKDAILQLASSECRTDSQQANLVKNIEDRLPSLFPTPLKIPNHPPYSEMIKEAIKELKQQGSTEESIARFIESKHPDLPFAHPHLVMHHIRKLLKAGEIASVQENSLRFTISNPNPIGDGTVSPPEMISTVEIEEEEVKEEEEKPKPKPKRKRDGRGRPKGSTGKKKESLSDGDGGGGEDRTVQNEQEKKKKRGRGRPRKEESVLALDDGEDMMTVRSLTIDDDYNDDDEPTVVNEQEQKQKQKRGRGRPRQGGADGGDGGGRGRGRGRVRVRGRGRGRGAEVDMFL